jgi:hypothetical protein
MTEGKKTRRFADVLASGCGQATGYPQHEMCKSRFSRTQTKFVPESSCLDTVFLQAV